MKEGSPHRLHISSNGWCALPATTSPWHSHRTNTMAGRTTVAQCATKRKRWGRAMAEEAKQRHCLAPSLQQASGHSWVPGVSWSGGGHPLRASLGPMTELLRAPSSSSVPPSSSSPRPRPLPLGSGCCRFTRLLPRNSLPRRPSSPGSKADTQTATFY